MGGWYISFGRTRLDKGNRHRKEISVNERFPIAVLEYQNTFVLLKSCPASHHRRGSSSGWSAGSVAGEELAVSDGGVGDGDGAAAAAYAEALTAEFVGPGSASFGLELALASSQQTAGGLGQRELVVEELDAAVSMEAVAVAVVVVVVVAVVIEAEGVLEPVGGSKVVAAAGRPPSAWSGEAEREPGWCSPYGAWERP